jgi:predicted site-specific integrase-resolvase
MTHNELAERLKVSSRTIARWERDGILPTPIQRGRKVLHDSSAVTRRLENAKGK